MMKQDQDQTDDLMNILLNMEPGSDPQVVPQPRRSIVHLGSAKRTKEIASIEGVDPEEGMDS